MSKNIKLFLIILITILISYFLIQFVYKTIQTGNNITKSGDDLIENILNISSYEAEVEVTINSNKTTNKYLLHQYHISPNLSKQIVKEPSNIEGLEIIYNGNKLEIKNTNLGLSKIYENYTYLNGNILWLNYFIEYCNTNKYTTEEDENEVILNTKIGEYIGKLYINKKANLPTKIEILDNSNKAKIYIEYKEIKLNNIQQDNILVYSTKDIKVEV